MRAILAVALVLALPAVQAGSPEAPELVDEAEDVTVFVSDQAAVPSPLQDAIDIRAVWFTDDAVGLHAHIQVTSLAVLDAQAGAQPDFKWIAIWSPGYAVEEGAADRKGTWELRAEHRPTSLGAPWFYWLERPCKDGDETDGCSGDDRDIIQGLPGSVDPATSTITVTAPWRHMEDPQPGDGIHGLWAVGQMEWPAWPASSVDWDLDQEAQCYTFGSLPFPAAALSAKDTGPTGGSNGRVGFPQGYDPSETCMPAGAPAGEGPSGAQDAGAGAGQASNGSSPVAGGSPTEAPAAKDAPLPVLLALVALTVALARRR